jgi:hypothetical protein
MSTTSPSSIQSPTIPQWINRIAIWLLRSPFHPLMSRDTLLLSFTGKKSGRHYTIPVRYLRDGDTLTTTTDSRWWRNLQGGAEVKLQLAGREVRGKADVSTNSEDVERAIIAILRQMPSDAHFYQVRLDRNGQPDMASVKRAAQSNVLITIHIASNPQERVER